MRFVVSLLLLVGLCTLSSQAQVPGASIKITKTLFEVQNDTKGNPTIGIKVEGTGTLPAATISNSTWQVQVTYSVTDTDGTAHTFGVTTPPMPWGVAENVTWSVWDAIYTLPEGQYTIMAELLLNGISVTSTITTFTVFYE